MRHLVLPTIDGPTEAWCEFCSNRNLPPEFAYCTECRPALNRYREAIDRRPLRRLARAFMGSAGASAPPVPGAAPPTRGK
jgi:hypothetical protein